MNSISTDAVLSRRTLIAIGIITAAATALVTYYISQKLRTPKIPRRWKPVGAVARLCIYPLKSGRRTDVQEAECTKQGLMEVEKPDKSVRLRDRAFVVYRGDNHEFRTATQHPKLILVEVKANDTKSVVMKAPGMDPLFLRIPSRNKHEVIVVKHFKQENIESIDCGDSAATWISQYILEKDNGLRLGYHDGSYKRTEINKIYKKLIEFYGAGLRNESTGLNSNLAAMHIINSASIADVNERMGNLDVTADNFRPTLQVSGLNLKPFEEDTWEWVKVGDVVMKNVIPCFRCILTTIHPETGIRRRDREPLNTLEKYRIKDGPDKTPVMGILLEVFETGVISVGDTVYVGN